MTCENVYATFFDFLIVFDFFILSHLLKLFVAFYSKFNIFFDLRVCGCVFVFVSLCV